MAIAELPPQPAPPPRGMNNAQLCPRCRAPAAASASCCPVDGSPLVINHMGREIDRRYRVEGFLGVGGMEATVWRATQLATGRDVAVKLCPSNDRTDDQRFERGARISSQLNHPNITTVHDFGRTADGFAFLVMELLEGASMQVLLKRGKPTLRTACHIADQVLRALDHAHAAGTVHRDLKPGNLYLTRKDDDTNFVKILDFGIAKQIRDRPVWDENDAITREQEVCGTPEYISPEQIRGGRVDARADLYSFGVVLYRLFTGNLPFRSRDWTDAWFSHLNEPVPPMPADAGVPPALEAVVHKAMAKRAEDRFADAREMRQALRDAVHLYAHEPSWGLAGLFPSPSIAAPAPTPEAPPTPSGAERLILLAAGTLAATAVLLAAWTVARIALSLWRGVGA
jgi:serine/threonine protein kinase